MLLKKLIGEMYVHRALYNLGMKVILRFTILNDVRMFHEILFFESVFNI